MGFVAVVRYEGLVHADPAGHQIVGKSQPDFVVDVGGVARVRHQVLVVCATIAECSLDDGGVAAVKGVEVAERGGEHQRFFRPAVSAFGVHGALSAINMILNDAAYLVGTVIDVTRAVLFLYDGRTVVERMFQRFVEGEVVARTPLPAFPGRSRPLPAEGREGKRSARSIFSTVSPPAVQLRWREDGCPGCGSMFCLRRFSARRPR